MPLCWFQASVASSLVAANKKKSGLPSLESKLTPVPSKLVKVQSTPTDDVRKDGIDHRDGFNVRQTRHSPKVNLYLNLVPRDYLSKETATAYSFIGLSNKKSHTYAPYIRPGVISALAMCINKRPSSQTFLQVVSNYSFEYLSPGYIKL